MQRDLDLVRTILLTVEAAPAGATVRNSDIQPEGVEPIVVSKHIELLLDAGFLNAIVSKTMAPTTRPRQCIITELTWSGHDYLDSVKNEQVWSQTKKALVKVGGTAGFEIVKQLAGSILKQQLGLP